MRTIGTLLLPLLLLAAACPRPARVPLPGTDERGELEIPLGQTRTVDDMRFAISFPRVLEESRCPADVQCVTAGNAKVGLVLQERGEATTTVELNTHRAPQHADHEGYRVHLLDLRPLPTATTPTPRDYAVRLRVAKL